jgi:hypothetical protein
MIARLLTVLTALFLLSFAAGASAAALTCADAPLTISAPSEPMDDCGGGHHAKKHDRALACTAMCAAIAPQLASVSPPLLSAASGLSHSATELTGRDRQLDPPPPRG